MSVARAIIFTVRGTKGTVEQLKDYLRTAGIVGSHCAIKQSSDVCDGLTFREGATDFEMRISAYPALQVTLLVPHESAHFDEVDAVALAIKRALEARFGWVEKTYDFNAANVVLYPPH